MTASARIRSIEYDPPGADVTGEHLIVENASANQLDLTGWTIRDAAPMRQHRYRFKRLLLAAGSSVRVWTKSGQDTETDLHWGLGSAIWNNTGDTAVLRDDRGVEVSRFRYPHGSQIAMVGLGVEGDTPPNTLQPPLADGIHLRWASPRSDGFPWAGYYLFRRAHRAGIPHWLSTEIAGLVPGPLNRNTLDAVSGRVSSERALLLTDDFSPSGAVEFDLQNRAFLRFRLAKDASARKWEVKIGFRDLPDLPPRVCVDFQGRVPGVGPNPRREEDPVTGQVVTFEAKHKDGRPRPNTHIQKMPVGSTDRTGLACEAILVITLPGVASHVDVSLSSNADAAILEAYNADGTRADRKTADGAVPVRLEGSAITSVVVEAPRGKTLLHQLCCQPTAATEIQLAAFAGRLPVARLTAVGRPRELKTFALEFDGMDTIELSGGQAALIDIGWILLDDEATVGWQPAPDFPSPMRLPITHPDYPCTPGAPEQLDQARAIAAQRIVYGNAADYTTPIARATSGLVAVTNGSPVVIGSGTNWNPNLAGTVFRAEHDATAYVVLAVPDANTLVLTRNYVGATNIGRSYSISNDPFGQLYDALIHLVSGGPARGAMKDRELPAPITAAGTISLTNGSAIVVGDGTDWDSWLADSNLHIDADTVAYQIAQVDSPTRLLLRHPYAGVTGAAKRYRIAARIRGSDEVNTPAMPRQFPLDLVLMSTVHPSVAQMIGVYWVDGSAQSGSSYDYLLVADHDNRGSLDPDRMLGIINATGLDTLDAVVIHNQKRIASGRLEAPKDVRAYALPDTASGASAVGLRWDRGVTQEGVLLPEQAITHHLWRANLGSSEPSAPPADSQYRLRTAGGPLLVAHSRQNADGMMQSARNWPSFPMHADERGLSDGWYSYAVSGVDIFGRHSERSAPAQWYQWSPMPEPRPWYYQDPVGDRPIHAFAVNVPDFVPPPAPTGMEAYALDPADPLLLKDATYERWWTELQNAPWYQALSQSEQRNLVGLRVRWRWTHAQARQAGDVREFRIYHQSGRLNAILGNTTGVEATGDTEVLVATDIANARPLNAYAGAWLRVGQDTFTIVASNSGSPLTVRVRNLGPRKNVRPATNTQCTVAVPPSYAAGRVAVTAGSALVQGTGTNWTLELQGRMFQVIGDLERYVVATVESPTRLTLDRVYVGKAAPSKSYGIRHPLFVDYSEPTAWDRRYHVVDYADARHLTETTDADGHPLRVYDVFLPFADGTFTAGLPLAPSVVEPFAYAHVGVSAADDKTYARDSRTTGSFSGRFGNEGRVAGPATVYRVLREKPPAPLSVPFPEIVYATPADMDGRSFFTYRWRPVPGLRVHIFRALDDAVFTTDWAQRPRPPLDPANNPDDQALFPTDPRWNSTKVLAVAGELNALNALKSSGASVAAARESYRALSNDAWRVVAGLPANETAFLQTTLEPIDPNDPVAADRRGPDSPDNYTPDPSLRALISVIDGRTTNRYFYRAAHVDGASNRGALSLASAPVQLSNVVPSLPPSNIKCTAGEHRITLSWASNRESDLLAYRVFRAYSADAARDLRLMTHMAVVPADPDPILRPAYVTWTDEPVQGLKDCWYRVVAVNRPDPVDPRGGGGNFSNPSHAIRARALDTEPPASPLWIAAERTDGAAGIRLAWRTDEPSVSCMVNRRLLGGVWRPVSSKVAPVAPPFDFEFVDANAEPGITYEYRIVVQDEAGNRNRDTETRTV